MKSYILKYKVNETLLKNSCFKLILYIDPTLTAKAICREVLLLRQIIITKNFQNLLIRSTFIALPNYISVIHVIRDVPLHDGSGSI